MLRTKPWIAFLAAACTIGCGSEPPSAAPEPRADAGRVEVVVTDAGERPIEAIKAVRAVTGLGLADAKALVDATPSVVASDLAAEEAERVAAELRAAGMTVELRER